MRFFRLALFGLTLGFTVVTRWTEGRLDLVMEVILFSLGWDACNLWRQRNVITGKDGK